MSKEFKYLKENKELSEWGCLVPTPIVEKPDEHSKQFWHWSESMRRNKFKRNTYNRAVEAYNQWLSSRIPVSKEFSDRYEDGWTGTEKDFEVIKVEVPHSGNYGCHVEELAYPLERDNEEKEGENIIEPTANQHSDSVVSLTSTSGNSNHQ